MRLLLSKKSRKDLFKFLKNKYRANSLLELSYKMRIPYKSLKKWRYAELYLPSHIIPKGVNYLNILDKQPDNWGRVKGGKLGGKRSQEVQKKKLGNEEYIKGKRRIGNRVMKYLWKTYGRELTKRAIESKISKRQIQSKELEEENSSFFTNKKVSFDLREIKFSKTDRLKNLKLPTEMSKELAEETGVHMGDGCLSYNKNYFSVKCNKIEEKYFTDYLFRIYKNLYNLNLKLKKLPSVSGFEIYSKVICEFKNKVIGLPYGKKVENLHIPKPIIETKDRQIYRSFIRGLFDTDGCVYLRYRRYPVISITIKSKMLITQLADMFKKLGFIPSVYRWTITLNGSTMLNKWIKEINSNNPKNMDKLKRASSIVG